VKDGGTIACIEGNIYYTIARGQCHHTCDKINNLLRTWILAPNFRCFFKYFEFLVKKVLQTTRGENQATIQDVSCYRYSKNAVTKTQFHNFATSRLPCELWAL
jgi:hypothetical protein